MAGSGSLDRLRALVRANTAWNTEIPHGTGLHRMSCIAEHAMETIDDVESEVDRLCVSLPTDKNGEVVHVGDVMNGWSGSEGDEADVTELRYDGDRWFAAHAYDSDTLAWYAVVAVGELEHHREPTLADMLREFAAGYADQIDVPTEQRTPVSDALVDAYAKAIADMTAPHSSGTDDGSDGNG